MATIPAPSQRTPGHTAPGRPLSGQPARPRHALSTRIWHWLNFISLTIMFMSGLNISNAHPHLYWGDWGFAPEMAWFDVPRFPGWATIPDYYSLAAARDWHVLFAWIFALGLLGYMIASLINRHFLRDLVTSFREWRPANIWVDIRAHLKLDFDHGAGKYNFLQKAAYGLVVFILLPLMIVSGMVMSPGMEATVSWLGALFGGRQSARSIHFLTAFALFGFFLLHVALVLLAGPIHQMRAMITGGRMQETQDEAA